MTIPPRSRTMIEVLVEAIEANKAFKVFKFDQGGPEKGPDIFNIVDCKGHIERVACANCGEKPKPYYSTNRKMMRVDEYESVILGCSCFRHVQLFTLRADFDRARGAVTNALASWWNQWQEPDYHPSDFEAAGGIAISHRALEEHFKKVTENAVKDEHRTLPRLSDEATPEPLSAEDVASELKRPSKPTTPTEPAE